MALPTGLLIEPQAVARIDAVVAASGMDGYRLMQAAGLAVSAAALRDFPEARRFVVLCGPGNNGGDGYVAAGSLARHGVTIGLFSLDGAPPATSDARRAMDECRLSPGNLKDYRPQQGDVVIDAIFGAGLGRDVPQDVARIIEVVTGAGIPVVAVDIPSGICGRSGAIRGEAFRASLTVTFMARKPGQLLLPGRNHCGRIEIAGIGVPDRFVRAHHSAIVENHPGLWRAFTANRQAESHKYAHGHLVVFSGGPSSTGAARLAALAGLRAGAGLVTLASPGDSMKVNAGHLTAVMLRETNDLYDLEAIRADVRINAFVLGPAFGIGEKARRFALALANRMLVLDADGISSFRDNPDELFSAFSDGEARLVLTPHEGEFGRLFPDLAKDMALSKVDRALLAARRSNAVVLLKGADTVIASPDGRAAINTNAPPWLATAGSGDVLAGMIGASLANDFPAFEAALAGAYMHGEAGQQAGPGLTAETLVKQIHRSIN
jgi:NAD(P)H-hydrate epimerase